MMRGPWRGARWAALFALVWLAPLGPRAGPGAGEVLEGVQRWLDGTRDLKARFTQTLVSGALGAGLEESGRLVVARPGRMRWDYLEPERKVAIVDGRRTRLYLEDEAQLIEGTLGDEGGLLPLLLAGDDRLAALFQASLLGPDARPGLRLRLDPRGSESSFEHVVLTVRGPEYALEEAEVFDRAGNRVRYRFEGMRRNRGLEGDPFAFVAPAGTEVAEQP